MRKVEMSHCTRDPLGGVGDHELGLVSRLQLMSIPGI